MLSLNYIAIREDMLLILNSNCRYKSKNMIIKELLVSRYSKNKNRLTDSKIESVRSKDPFVHSEEKTKTYFQLDSLIEHLKVYRDELRGSRVPIYERSFIRTQQERKRLSL